VKNPSHRKLAVLFFALSSVALMTSPQSAAQSPSEYAFSISSSQPWTDTGVDLSASDTLAFTAETKSGSADSCSVAGTKSASSEKLPLQDAPAGVLIARISENGTPQLVGTSGSLRVDNAGHLFLGVNGSTVSDCAFAVKVEIVHAQNSAQQPAAAKENVSVKEQLSSAAKVWLQGQFGGSSKTNGTSANGTQTSALSGNTASGSATPANTKLASSPLDGGLQTHIDDLPRRVHDHVGNPGDMVNFVIVGSQEKVQGALDAAAWHLADVDSKEAGLKAIMNTYEKKDYLEMPMSHLYLFDRMQDFGYEQAQAYAVVASRHHFRMWKAPFTWKDETVWEGAGTHDIGFEKDIRTGHLTHKIDPDVDVERENIAQSLGKSGKIKSTTYYLPPNPLQDAKNASGGGYHSDGRLLVVFLQ